MPDSDLTVGKFAALRTAACVANYGVLYLLKRVRQQIHAAVSPECPAARRGFPLLNNLF